MDQHPDIKVDKQQYENVCNLLKGIKTAIGNTVVFSWYWVIGWLFTLGFYDIPPQFLVNITTTFGKVVFYIFYSIGQYFIWPYCLGQSIAELLK